MVSSKEVKEFYDNEFLRYQKRVGVNLRHLHIFNQVVRSGLKRNHSLLEIGCGIGALTGLFHTYLRYGKILAMDISSKSVDLAKSRFKKSKRVHFIAADINDYPIVDKYDYILLADVLEHIPIESHSQLFTTIGQLLSDRGKVVINIPHPKMIDFMRTHTPEALQIVDQALDISELILNARHGRLFISSCFEYSLFNQENDYIMIVLTNNYKIEFTPLSKIVIIIRKFKERLIQLASRFRVKV